VTLLISLAQAALEQDRPVIVAAMSPFAEGRRQAREQLGARFFEIFCDCPLSVLEVRDPKGLYLAQREGRIRNLSGVDAPYEKPERPDLLLRTDLKPAAECTQDLLALLGYSPSV